MNWLAATYSFQSALTLAVFSHASLGAAAERYIKELVADTLLSPRKCRLPLRAQRDCHRLEGKPIRNVRDF